jgi:hypothetical protein
VAKGLKTRQKLVFRTDGLRPRNPLVVAAHRRPAGAHTNTPGGQRLAAKRRLKRLLNEC